MVSAERKENSYSSVTLMGIVFYSDIFTYSVEAEASDQAIWKSLIVFHLPIRAWSCPNLTNVECGGGKAHWLLVSAFVQLHIVVEDNR